MAEIPQDRRLSLDTNILFDLAAGEKFAFDFKDRCQQRGYALLVVPCVAEELDYNARKGKGEKKRLANAALDSLLEWGITPIAMPAAQRAWGQNFVAFIGVRNILPREEINDARILAETAIAKIPMLVTSDTKTLEASIVDLKRAFRDSGLTEVYPVHPKRLTIALRKAR